MIVQEKRMYKIGKNIFPGRNVIILSRMCHESYTGRGWESVIHFWCR